MNAIVSADLAGRYSAAAMSEQKILNDVDGDNIHLLILCMGHLYRDADQQSYDLWLALLSSLESEEYKNNLLNTLAKIEAQIRVTREIINGKQEG